MCPVSSKVVVLGNQQGLDLGSVKSMAQGSQVRDSPIFLVDLGWWCQSARCFKHCCQAATVYTFCCCTRSICMLAAGVDSRPWATGQCWYDMLNMYIDTAPQMLAMLASIMRIWEPQAGAHKNIFFQKIITLVITKLILKIFICLASFISVSCGSS